ncbi:MAG: S8 family peptidase [Lachnospiraceae bacterium]|nr:S8 family peptidase [Lachnospiraceae bacterium]
MNDLEKAQSCITQVTQQEPYLTGEGVIIAVLDSGIDYFLPEFRGADGQTRILAIWDQTQQPDEGQGKLPPPGYREGVLYTREMINEALALGRESGQRLVPVFDVSGHGTAVAGVAAGTGMGVAPRAELLVIRLGNPQANSFPRTTQLMRGLNYAVNLGVELGRPVAVNLSFGNTYGDHQGNSLLERFIDNASEIGRSAIIIGSGNEGASGGHTAGVVQGGSRVIELAVADYETGLSIQLWKFYQDVFQLAIISPGGERTTLELSNIREAQAVRRTLEQTQLLCYLGKPLPYNVQQEIFIDMIPAGSYLNSGVWRMELQPVSLVTGEYRLYLPSYAARSAATGFFLPTPEMTITIPSTARRVVTVGAYDVSRRSYADFSGRGYVYRYSDGRTDTAGGEQIIADVKPDLTAPGVNITVPMPNGGYEQVSGTSFATPFVTGAAALLMEWGIVRGNDRFLYGERLKASLIRGAQSLAGVPMRPDSRIGWGTLCVERALESMQ